MIFVTVGTTYFKFERMALYVKNNLLENNKIPAIIFQHGMTELNFNHKRLKSYPYLSFKDTENIIKKAEIIICHGGPATIFQSLSAKKIPWVMPRLKKFGEHVNDHQLCFVNFLKEKKLIRELFENTEYDQLKIMGNNSFSKPALSQPKTLINFLNRIT